VNHTRVTASGDAVAQQDPSRPVKYHGFSARESAVTPAAAAFNIRTGGASGDIIDVVELAADGSVNVWYDNTGIQARDGIYVEVVSGAVEVIVKHS